MVKSYTHQSVGAVDAEMLTYDVASVTDNEGVYSAEYREQQKEGQLPSLGTPTPFTQIQQQQKKSPTPEKHSVHYEDDDKINEEELQPQQSPQLYTPPTPPAPYTPSSLHSPSPPVVPPHYSINNDDPHPQLVNGGEGKENELQDNSGESVSSPPLPLSPPHEPGEDLTGVRGSGGRRKQPVDKDYFIAKELLTTERTYAKDLLVINGHLRVAWEGEPELRELCGAVPQLLQLTAPLVVAHTSFLAALENRLANCCSDAVQLHHSCSDIELHHSCSDAVQLHHSCSDIELHHSCSDVIQLHHSCSDVTQLHDSCSDVTQLHHSCSDVTQLHDSCSDVIQLHETVCYRDGRGGTSKPDASAQRIVDLLKTQLDHLPLYEDYLQQLQAVLEGLQAAMKRSRRFELFYLEFEAEKVCYLPFTAFVLKPIFRLNHYLTILESMSQHYVSTGHSDVRETLEVKAKLSRTVTAAQPRLMAAAQYVKLVEVERDLVGLENLVQPGRTFIREGCLQKLSRKGYQQRMFFLFNDVLLYTNRTGAPGLKFKVHGQLLLWNVMVEETESTMGADHCFTIYGNNR
ncbi:Dbl (DH) domain [Trinorchestia longiramus]|nr:Dbl (DH) domain [Trinorchestia longiramus]